LQQTPNGFETVNFPVASTPYLPGWSITAGDFNGDGFNDLMYGSGTGVTFMLSSSTGFNRTYAPVYGDEYVFSQRGNFVDINDDGKLDAYMCHDVDRSVYYINEDNTPVFHQGGLGDYPTGEHYGSIWID